ncbi:MAG TPA: hypothetical protein VHM89_02975 [Acidimicrobiales bacterium]|nr:hypothetical protein [Acidimicrobiales bacterium]
MREGRWFIWLVVVLATVLAADTLHLLPGSDDDRVRRRRPDVLGEVITRDTVPADPALTAPVATAPATPPTAPRTVPTTAAPVPATVARASTTRPSTTTRPTVATTTTTATTSPDETTTSTYPSVEPPTDPPDTVTPQT